MSEALTAVYDAREAATIARYLMEDLTGHTFWSEQEVLPLHEEIMVSAKQRLLQHEPWQYIGGVADFYGLQFRIDPSVLIPRPETEELVYMALDLQKQFGFSSVLDVGTGSGCIAVTLALKGQWDKVHALDAYENALEIARGNAARHAVEIHFSQGDFLNPDVWPALPAVSLVVSNPPYITVEEAPLLEANVVQYEPSHALFVKDDAMEFYHALAQFVSLYQPPGCHLLTEIHEKNGDAVKAVFRQHGLDHVSLFQDLQGRDRFVIGVRPA